jgi:hypothetical protein
MKYHWNPKTQAMKTTQAPKITTKVASNRDEIKLMWRAYQGLIVAAIVLWFISG